MKNSKELCHPLSLPFACYEIDSRQVVLKEELLTHYYAELFYLQEGKLLFDLGPEELTVSAGEAVFVCPGVTHRMKHGDANHVRMIILRMDPDRLHDEPVYSPTLKTILMEAWRTRVPMVIPASVTERIRMGESAAQCLQEAERRAFGYDLNIISRLSMMIVEIIRFWTENGLNIRIPESQEDPICSLTGYIQRHLRDGLRVEDLAARCGLSYPWFAKKFREIYGISCKDYIEQIRVAQVEQFLLLTDLDLSRISEATGYADCSHMIKNFKRLMSITPGQYRLQRKK